MVHDRLERLRTPDGDHITLARMGVATPDVPHLLVLHGLEGTLRAKYAHGLLTQARARGWTGDLMLFRSCDGEMNSAPRLYHSGETSDLEFVVQTFAHAHPRTPLVICGISLGGNVLLKWLGETGPRAREIVTRAAAVSVPFDLAAGSRYLEKGFSRAYARHFLATLRVKAIQKCRQYPTLLDADAIQAARTIWEFDDVATAPLHGFSSAAHYYEESSSIRFLNQVRVPTLLFSAFDDPFVPQEVVRRVSARAESVPSLTVDFTQRGGHVGWIEGVPLRERYYMEERVAEFLGNWQ